MELARLVEELSRPEAYPHPAEDLQVHHTHISVVFLAGPFAYKIKKPLDLGFLDFTTLERRRHFCLEEVRLNSRLAPGVYSGVVPLFARSHSSSADSPPGGSVRVGAETIEAGGGEVLEEAASGETLEKGGGGEDFVEAEGGEALEAGGERVVEYAVRMERLPDEATLESRVLSGEVEPALMPLLARRIAAFHAEAEGGERVAACGRWDVVARNARENFEQSAAQVGTTLSAGVYQRLRALTEMALQRLRPTIERRAESGVPRDTHGDLRLDHVYLFPERSPPRDLVIVDCIEFNERFRYADPVSDMAFLAMDLAFNGRRDLSRAFADAYFEASGDLDGRALLPFYSGYRASVRGKVEGFEASSGDVPEHERADALRQSRGHWLLALGALEEPARRPALVLIGGLPGTGKSTLARELAGRAGFEVVSSDVVRKELAGLEPSGRAGADFGRGLYTTEWNDRTYTECLRRAEEHLFEGRRVIVDASFREEARRRLFLDAARSWGVPGLLLICTADRAVVERRLRARTRDVSDADVNIYQKAAAAWEEPGPLTRQALREVRCGSSGDGAVKVALEALHSAEL